MWFLVMLRLPNVRRSKDGIGHEFNHFSHSGGIRPIIFGLKHHLIFKITILCTTIWIIKMAATKFNLFSLFAHVFVGSIRMDYLRLLYLF